MLINEAFQSWKESIFPLVVAEYGEDDRTALAESWNDYTDGLAKDGELTALQYHYTPAFDDAIPDGDAEAEAGYLLDAMGVRVHVEQVEKREGVCHENWPDGTRHFAFTVSRARYGGRYRGFYSMGPALTEWPERVDILQSLFLDASGTEYGFEDWCADLGYDDDSRKAEAVYNACVATRGALEQMFGDDEYTGLETLFQEI
jgi:hypothetical protein